MTIEHDTTEATNERHPSQTLEGAKRAAAILQQPPVMITEHEFESVYVSFGAGRALAVDNAGRFSMLPLERDGRASVVLTREETQALHNFWIPICTQLVVQHIKEAVARINAERTQEADHREEMTCDQALALLQPDEVLMTRLIHITTDHALKHIDAMAKEKAVAGE